MNRCASGAASIAALATLLLAALPVSAQVQRHFPKNALRGQIVFGQPPDVQVNGQAARLSPAARIHGQNNMLLMSGSLIGTKAVVHYVVDPLGNVSEAWLLTDAERAVKPWPVTPAQADAWTFDFGSQTWSK